MELKACDAQKISIELSREEFQTLARMAAFIDSAYDTIDRELITINTPRHKVDVVLHGIAAIAEKCR